MPIEELDDSKELMALRRAVAKALNRRRRLGQYAVVWRDGQTVRLEPDELGNAGDYGIEPSAPASSVREPDPGGGDKGECRQ